MLQPPPLSPFLRAYYRWKALRLPWRRQFLVGLDLKNNTFWEFRDRSTPAPNGNNSPNTSPQVRWRRIVYPPAGSKLHPSEIQISPAWHQWLRHTRPSPPSLSEQAADVVRQEQMKVLAAQADARWAAKPGYVDAPAEAVRKPPLVGGGMVVERGEMEQAKEQQEQGKVEGKEQGKDEGEELRDQRKKTWERMQERAGSNQGKQDPWKHADAAAAAAAQKGGPGGQSGEWQPEGWKPAVRK